MNVAKLNLIISISKFSNFYCLHGLLLHFHRFLRTYWCLLHANWLLLLTHCLLLHNHWLVLHIHRLLLHLHALWILLLVDTLCYLISLRLLYRFGIFVSFLLLLLGFVKFEQPPANLRQSKEHHNEDNHCRSKNRLSWI